ncbi:MAG: DoxX family protein [Chloroherpetonaceae bacterium]
MLRFKSGSRPITIDGAILLLRLWLGAMMIYHGFPKVFTNNAGFIEYLTKFGFPAPSVMAALAGGAEFFGGILIVIGFLTRPALMLVLITMLVAGFVAHGAEPFTKQELPLTYAMLSLVLFLSGAGAFSIERTIAGKS